MWVGLCRTAVCLNSCGYLLIPPSGILRPRCRQDRRPSPEPLGTTPPLSCQRGRGTGAEATRTKGVSVHVPLTSGFAAEAVGGACCPGRAAPSSPTNFSYCFSQGLSNFQILKEQTVRTRGSRRRPAAPVPLRGGREGGPIRAGPLPARRGRVGERGLRPAAFLAVHPGRSLTQ